MCLTFSIIAGHRIDQRLTQLPYNTKEEAIYRLQVQAYCTHRMMVKEGDIYKKSYEISESKALQI